MRIVRRLPAARCGSSHTGSGRYDAQQAFRLAQMVTAVMVNARIRLRPAERCGMRGVTMGAKLSEELPLVDELNEEAPVDLIEVTGVIKWFDASKGYGFIVPDGGLPDVLLHVTCLRRGGFQTAYEGARVVCEVLQRPKGLQAFRVLSMDETTAIHPSQVPPRTHVTVTPTRGLARAQVKW